MREISPHPGMSVDEYLKLAPELTSLVNDIRQQKERGERARPSTPLIDQSAILTKEQRADLLDKIALLVDENWVGRSEMCFQFTGLLNRALRHIQFPSREVLGTATYYSSKGKKLFQWRHAWVRVGQEVIDGNVDSIPENILVPRTVSVAPYWGLISETPPDRLLRELHGESVPGDVDVDEIWWPELEKSIDSEILKR